MKKKRILSRLALLLALSMALAGTAALADTEFQAVVSADSMNVYTPQAPYTLLGSLPKGTKVTVQAYSGVAALISYAGRTGISRVSDMSPVRASTDAQAVGRTMVASRDTRVYSRANTSSAYTSVGAGTSLEVLAVNGNCAKVLLNGQVGYAVYSHLGEPSAQAAQPADEPVQTGSMAVVTAQAAPVYADANSFSSSVTLPAGAKLTLLAVRGDWAMVERNGAIGYTPVSNLAKDAASAAAETAKTRSNANPFSADSNEYAIYAFLTGELGYNRAAAMGVMANIKYESGYRPTVSGDSGTSYGICQWHLGRKTNLINYCAENGLDYAELESQLKFLKYELTTRYPSVHSYLKQVENSAEGAYDAGYYFCFNFEAPAARTSQSTKRGAYARDTLYV